MASKSLRALAAQKSHRKIAMNTVAAGGLANIPLQKSQGFSLPPAAKTIASPGDFFFLTTPTPPPVPTNPPGHPTPEGLILVHFSSFSIRFGSVWLRLAFRVCFGASVREKNITTLIFLSLFFLVKMQGKLPKKQGLFIIAVPLKSLGKKGKTR